MTWEKYWETEKKSVSKEFIERYQPIVEERCRSLEVKEKYSFLIRCLVDTCNLTGEKAEAFYNKHYEEFVREMYLFSQNCSNYASHNFNYPVGHYYKKGHLDKIAKGIYDKIINT